MIRGIALTTFMAVGTFTTPARGQALDPVEQRIIRWIDDHRDEQIAFLERVVNVNSGTMNHDGVQEVGRLFRAELDALGFATRWVALPDTVNRAGHLFAERRGERGRRVLLIGQGTSAEITFRDSYPPMAPTDGNAALLDAVSRDLGLGTVEPVDPALRGAADVSFVAPHVDALDGLGPAGSGGHTTEETIDLRSLPVVTKRAAVLIYRLTRRPGAT